MGICVKLHFAKLGVDTFPVSQVDRQKFAFWDHKRPSVFLDLAQHKKDTMLPALENTKLIIWR